jgi:hypothetical protein
MMAVPEAATLAKKAPPVPARPVPDWSPEKFARAWATAKDRRPDFRVKHMAQRADVTTSTLHEWKKTGGSKPDINQAFELASYLMVDLMDLVE